MDESTLIKYLKNETDQEECLQVEEWCEASADNRKELEDLYCVLFVGDRHAAMEAVDVDKSLDDFKKKLKQKQSVTKKTVGWKRYAVNIAAFLIGVICTGGALGIFYQQNSSYIISTEPGQRAQAVLPDGTKLWLNASTSVEYLSSIFSSERRVRLEGEAYFEVKKNTHRPFIVDCHDIETKVTGTKFNIRNYKKENSLKATLLEGSIEVSLPIKDKKEICMTPNEQLSVNLLNLETNLKHTENANEAISWIKGSLHFDQTTLKEIAETLERHYNVLIKIDDIKLQQQRFTCDFDLSDDISQVLSILSFTKSFDYRIKDNEVTLSARKP
ncbi:FecR family protein [Bacteroides sp.]|uniref:FecR family protein n=1 Tax=Bacteroides sp. TaxID=29523 RepID=UPI00261A1AD8|nr:FecR domain-containing protein [Bacteroides sp.]